MSYEHDLDLQTIEAYRAVSPLVWEDLERTYVRRLPGDAPAVEEELAQFPEPYRSVAEKAQRLLVVRLIETANKLREVTKT